MSSGMGEETRVLEGEEKKVVISDCEGEGARRFLLFLGLSVLEGEDRLPGEEMSGTGEAFRMISS